MRQRVAALFNADKRIRSSKNVSRKTPSLNQDVVEAICDAMKPKDIDLMTFSWADGSEQRDNRFFASLCLVSKLWLAPARRILYSVLMDQKPSRPDAADRILLTLESVPITRTYVHRLYLREETQYSEPFLERVLELIPLLPQCTLG
jgi:hypothetical protein